MKSSIHDFYCTKCGNKGIPLYRPQNYNREKFHKKKLFCIYCGMEVNHVECRNSQEVSEFVSNFTKGVYNEK